MQAEVALRRTSGDEGMGRAIALAIGLHLLLAAVFWLSAFFEWQRDTGAAGGLPVMNADLDATQSEQAAAREALEFVPEPLPEPVPEPVEEEVPPPPQPLPEPLPDDAVVERQVQAQERVPVPDEQEQEAVDRDAVSAQARAREQEEKRRQEQIDLTEQQRQREAEQRQRLAAQAEADNQRDREKQLAQIRAERAKLQKQAELSEQRLKQLADRKAQAASAAASQSNANTAAAGASGNDDGLRAQYAAALVEAIRSKWTRPDNVPVRQKCRITIRQLPGGEVMDVSVSPSCPYDEGGRRSVEAAVLKAQPLPYDGFESVFQRTLNLNFEAAD